MRLLGIDLGTTNTVVATDGFALPISPDDGRSTLPSVVSFLPNGTTRVGLPAKRRRSIDPAHTILSAKRIIGRRFVEPETRRFQESHPFEIVDVEGSAGFRTRAGDFSPVDIAAILLRTVWNQVRHVPKGFDATVVTVPAGFNARQREATVAAIEKAGFGNVRLIDEPLATAYAYTNLSNPVGRAGVYDLGGGTFEFSVVDWTRGTPNLVARESDLLLGGDDVDQLLAAWVAEEVLKQHGWDLRSYRDVYARLVAECERAKIRLSFFDETRVDLTQVDPEGLGSDAGMSLHRGALDRLSDDLVRRTFALCDRVLSEAGMRASDLDAVFLAGGSTHLNRVREGVEGYFGREGRFDLEPTEVVALGACRYDWSGGIS